MALLGEGPLVFPPPLPPPAPLLLPPLLLLLLLLLPLAVGESSWNPARRALLVPLEAVLCRPSPEEGEGGEG